MITQLVQADEDTVRDVGRTSTVPSCSTAVVNPPEPVPCGPGKQAAAVLAQLRNPDDPRAPPSLDRWRYAIYFTDPSGIADGALNDLAPASEPGTAQTACRLKADELTHGLPEVQWRESDQPD
ncbi:hypothetical protein ACFVSN_35855 [Kitasatospora sp. NPDC057904]|uniref:hypothetical protein n=1 Tax=unclassified Kitasatospora TaxID=2633591 RepID=UPI0036DB8897